MFFAFEKIAISLRLCTIFFSGAGHMVSKCIHGDKMAGISKFIVL